MKEMSVKQVDKAIGNISSYYRNSRLYTYLSNRADAKDWYIQEYTDDTRIIVEQGFSCFNKNEYLIALRLEVLQESHPDVFEHYFSCIWDVLKPVVDRESSDVLFICAVGPSLDHFTSDTYKLVNQFVEKYGGEYCIITDCPVEIDFKDFARCTGSSLIRIAGREYFRWPKRR